MGEISITIAMEEAKYFSNSYCTSFFNKYGGINRFVPMVVSKDYVESNFSNTGRDAQCSMYFVEDYLKALILSKVFKAEGYEAVVLHDEYMLNEDDTLADEEYIVLVNKEFGSR